MDMAPKLRELSHLEVHVFTILSIFANFKREPLGVVEMSMTEIAREVGIRRSSLYRTLSALERTGLVETVSSGDTKRLLMRHYLSPHETPPVSSGDTKSPQPQPSIGSCEPPIRSEEVSEEEVKKKREVARELELKAVANQRKDRSAKASPPHPLNGLVSWDKEKREVRLEEETTGDGRWCKGKETLRNLVGITANREKLPLRLTNADWQEGWGRLNGHLIGAPFKTNPRTLPAFVLNWFENDLRRKNNNPQRGKPLAQRIEEKTRERMNDGIEESGQEDNGFTQQLLESGDFRRHS